MNKKFRVVAILVLVLGIIFSASMYLHGHPLAVMNPKGMIASKERSLIVTSTILMLLVVVPVLILTFFIAWKYRESNTNARYTPEWDHNTKLEFIWWMIPCIIIFALSVLAWKSSHELDPFKALASDKKPLVVQVVALQWRWLFIYPEQNIATVNFVQFPQDTPIDFEITSDAPMNSFWIPQLGGQIYAMAGMNTQLHLIADEPGNYAGSSANISGEGFAGMKFIAKASSDDDFMNWVNLVKQSRSTLTTDTYSQLSQPSKDTSPLYYASSESGLYDKILMKYTGSMTMHAEGAQ